jgi:hypothetical protein
MFLWHYSVHLSFALYLPPLQATLKDSHQKMAAGHAAARAHGSSGGLDTRMPTSDFF